ncbi:DNA-binding transcriptional MerR regulator [Herbihabitans rhizosphaerae]|uniref:DNA-binding transcriptional MerR regulator n=1 Tax=Herbihabitans rhizosphaerae TaxID=1872711 RepID=A0A4Q7KKC3_9PSEU|nr:MerR family transcriptional regulator [Herbihabitans rhizosphaerae]RZS37009.1 DNA-binding transcriptional MerR regulator [Herbihabitans rhizosphaerae]
MAEYRIEELARVAGTSVRNVRVYQDRALLPPPARRGRTAIYSDAHLSRLRLVINMLDRGYAFAHIKEMLTAWENGRSLADVLGLEEAIGARLVEERPVVVALSELRRMFGKQATPANIAKALKIGLLERHGRRLVVPNPALLDAGRELVELGVPLSEAISLAGAMQDDVDHVTGLVVRLVRKYVLDPRGPDWLPSGDELPYYTDLIGRLRPLLQSVVMASVARSAERVIPEVLGDRLVSLAEEQARDGRRTSG